MRVIKTVITLLSVAASIAFLYFEGRLTGVNLCVALAFFFLSSTVHLLSHESGHLIGGAVSGYKLLCLQLGPLHIIADADNKLMIRVKNTFSGQCIMIPKQIYPVRFKAYNMGGVYANAAVTLLSFALLLFNSFYMSLLLIVMLCVGVQKIAANSIPNMKDSIPNDGYIVKLLKKSEAVQKDYAMYLRLYGSLFLNEEISPQEYEYEREMSEDGEEMMYYNEIQDILNSVKSEKS